MHLTNQGPALLTPEEEQFLSDSVSSFRDYLVEGESQPVVKVQTPQQLAAKLPQLDAAGVSLTELHAELEGLLDDSVRTAHPLFLNNLLAGFDPVGWVGEIASSLLNPTMATFEVAPLLTVIEKRMSAELLRLFRIERGQGTMVTGGSNANLLAVLCARTHYDSSLRLHGLPHNRFRVYVSKEAHYSFDKACNITGIGTDNLVLVASNPQGEMIADELERLIVADIQAGYTPIMVGATVGTTVLGAADPLHEIANICEAHKLWFHVDAAWGGGAIFSERARGFLDGVQRADSVTFDAHKTLGAALITSFFLTSHPAILRSTTRGGGAEYLFHEDDPQWDTGTYSLQCGRRADAVKMWLLWRHHGTEGLGRRMDYLLSLSELAAAQVARQPRLRMVHACYLNVCFQVLPRDPAHDINAFTLQVREALVKTGRTLVNYAEKDDGTIFFRLVFPNHQTRPEHVTKLIGMIVETADALDPTLVGATERPTL